MTNQTTITAAARQYANRPADECYPSVQAMLQAAQERKAHSRQVTYNAKDLRAVPTAHGVDLASPKAQAGLTHWAFGQLARSIGAPAGYLRELSPELAADCVNFGLQNTPPASDLNILLQVPNGNPKPMIRACTSESYARVWDADLLGPVVNAFMQTGQPWMLPPTWSGEPRGAYMGDRDSFLILVNGGSIVTDPSLQGRVYQAQGQAPAGSMGGSLNEPSTPADGLYRGLMIRNSEVGAASIVIDQILFRYICGNHMIWGAVIDKSYRRRHVGSADRSAIREITSIAFNWTNAGAKRDEAIIRTLIDHEIAKTRDAVIDELRGIGFTKAAAEAAYASCEQTESVSPRSFWGIAQGATRISQESGYQDERYQLDQLAAKVLQQGAKRYALA